MRDHRTTEEETTVLRWGGLSGFLGSLLMILVFGIVFIFAAPDITEPEELVRFPDIRVARTFENGLYLVALALWIPHFLALYRGLRATSPAPALFGSVLGVVGLTLLAAGTLPHIAMVPLAAAYHAPEATPAVQEALVHVWQATAGVFSALLGAGLLVATMGLIALGAAILSAPVFGAGLGWMTAAIGVLGVVASAVFIVDPPSPIAAVGFLGTVVFHLAVGWRLFTATGRATGRHEPA